MKPIHSMSRLTALFICILFFAQGCQNESRRKIFYINSYHDGYPSSDDIREGILETLNDEAVILEVFYMDTKRNPDPDMVAIKVREALEIIERFNPDLILASDDNAVDKLVVPHLQDLGHPIVFCGVNWSTDKYELKDNVTGMLEVLPLRECIQTIQRMNPDISSISVLSENSQSERNNRELLDTLYRNLGLEVEYRLVDDFAQWKAAFIELGASTDLIYMPTNGAIKNWDSEEARAFVEGNLNVPTITCDDFMMEYCVFGLTKVAREQGEWAAQTALDILNGQSPSEIPFAHNHRFNTCLNKKLGKLISFNLHEETKENVIVLE